MNIVLIGYRGAGKSTVGRRLADRLGREFVDTDGLIEERHGASIRDMVGSGGWQSFRDMEKRIIEGISNRNHLVIAPGGGAVLDPRNVEALKKNGLILWLKADPQVLSRRIAADPRTVIARPALTGKGILEEIGEVMASRNPYYERAADGEIDTSALDLEEVVGRILFLLHERMRGTE